MRTSHTRSSRARFRLEMLEDRLAPAGGLDPTFNGDGRLALDIGPNSGGITITSMLVQPDGKTILAGGPLVQRLNTDGSLDATFSNGSTDAVWDGGDGIAYGFLTASGGVTSISAVALQTDAKILAAGGGTSGATLWRLNADGTRDLTWGTSSFLALPVVGAGLNTTGLLVQPDGKILVAGYARMIVLGVDTGNDFAVVRLNADGTLDTTFDGDGIRTVAIGTGNVSDVANAVALQSDGRIVLAGQSAGHTAVARLNPDGSLDTGFDGDGLRTFVLSSFSVSLAQDVTIQPDGKIVLAGGGSGTVQLNYEFAAIRLNPDGSSDSTFGGGDGLAYPVSPTGLAQSVAVAPDGKIVLAGSGPRPTPAGGIVYDGFCVAVLNANGSVDTTFSGDGVLNFEPSSVIVAGNALRAVGVAVMPAGQFLVGGTSYGSGFNLGGGSYGPFRSATLVRLNADGTFDSAFDGDGIVLHTNRLLGIDAGNAAALQPDGKIVIGGNSHFTFTTNADFALARVNPDGTLDATFGVNGVLTTNLAGQDVVNALAVQPDGKIIAAGGSNVQASNLDQFSGVARYHANGTLDTTFGTGGILNLNLGTTGEVFTGIALQPNGKILLGGHIRTAGGTDWDFAVVRLNSDGSYDNSFGVGGLARFALGITDFEFNLAVLADGRILASGRSDTRGAVVRLNPDGSLDTTFDADGIVYFGGSGLNQIRSFTGMAVQADGKLVFSGSALPVGSTATQQLAVARLNADGSVDTSFGGDGVQVVAIGPASNGESIAVSWDGRILVGGNSGGNFVAVRLLTDGTPDPSFDGDGVATVDMAGTPYGYVDPTTTDTLTALLIQPDGNVVLVGSISATPLPGSGTSDFGIARLDGGGVPPIDIQISNGLIAENAGANAPIGALVTFDPNTLDTHTYSLVAGAGDTHNADFVIVGNQLRAATSFDYETGPIVRTVRIRTTDQNGFFYEEAFTITIANVNEAPTANNDAYTTSEDTPLTVALPGVLSNDSDPEGDALSAVLVSGPTNGSLSLAANGSFTYTPNANFNGADSFNYRSSDGSLTSNIATVTITLIPVNDAPTANAQSVVGNEDTALTLTLTGDDGDPDVTQPLTFATVSGPSHGTLIGFDPLTGVATYVPFANYHGPDSFTFTTFDGALTSVTATVAIQVRNLVDVSGRVFDDRDNDGAFELGDGDVGIGGVAVQLVDETTSTLIATRTTDANGIYVFDVNLGAGNYKVVAAQPGGFLDGAETAGNLGGGVDNTQDAHSITGISVGAPGTTADAIDYLFAEIRPSQALGLVWRDDDNDGLVDHGETAIAGVTIELTGIDDRGMAVSRSATTDANGIYSFINLRPSQSAGFTIRELQPSNHLDGIDSLGTVNGATIGNGTVNDTFSGVILSSPGSLAENYNFGERLVSDGGVVPGQTATIGFWQNKNGQNLIKALNGGSTATQLSAWLAATFPNMYGANAGINNLTGKTNAQVAAFYKTLFARTAATAAGGGPAKMDAQVLATAFAVYVTNSSLASTTAASYGFQVSANGVGTRTFNVGNNGAAFGVANNADVSVLGLLLAVNTRSKNGLLFDLDGDGDANDALESSYRTIANSVFTAINEAGDI